MQVQPHQPRLGRRRRGVTLIELLAVMAILALLMGVVWLAVAGRVKASAKQTQLKSDMRQVILAVNLYRNDNDSGLPSNWQYFGYYALIKKGAYGDGYPLTDILNPKPPTYDVSYHTPECAEPPKAPMGFLMFRQMVAQFEARPRANTLDIEHDQAAIFTPACLANSLTKRHRRILQAGEIKTPPTEDRRVLGANLAGSLSYQFYPDWCVEAAIGY